MEENFSPKMGDEISLQATVNLLDDFGRKKLYFEDTIGKLKNFNLTQFLLMLIRAKIDPVLELQLQKMTIRRLINLTFQSY